MSNERDFFKYIPKFMVEEIKESERLNEQRFEYVMSFLDRFVLSLNDDFIKKLKDDRFSSRSDIKEYLRKEALLNEVRLLFLKKKKKEEDADINSVLENKDLFMEYFLSVVKDPFREKIHEFEKQDRNRT